MRNTTLLALVLPLITLVSAQSSADSIPARWGQASALVGSYFVVQGGKTQGTTGGGYTYNSAPSDAQMYSLDLSSTFSLSSPPWQPVSLQQGTTAAPPVSFHTISPLNATSLLLFGGDASPLVPVQTGNDSAYILHLGGSNTNRTVAYQPVPAAWDQPMRRIGHTSESNTQGSVWIVGGEKADGSGIQLNQQWNIDSSASSPSFQLLSSSPPGSLVGATSTLLSDGTLLLLGGVDASGQLQSMQNPYAYSSKSSKWSQAATQTSNNSSLSARQSAFPAPRRNHIAVSLPNQRIFIQGGASADLSTVYSDAWILDWSANPPVWTLLNDTGGPGPRFGHSAVAYGRNVLISFGWTGGNAAPTGLHLFDATSLTASAVSKGSWQGGSWSETTYTPDPQASSPSTSAPNSGSSSGSSTTGSSTSANGSSSSSGGNAPSSSSDANSGSDSSSSGGTDTQPGTFPTGNVSHGGDGPASTDSDSGSSGGAKAGAAVGAIVGVGLVLGAGYAIYRRRSLNNYRRYGDASVGLLGFAGRRTGGSGFADDDHLMMEKGYVQSDYDRPYHRADGGAELAGGIAYGRKRGRSEGSPWAAANLGHAMEGSGPHFRERIAILAGRGKRDTQLGPRFDMLADEGDGNSLFRPHGANGSGHTYDHELEEAESPVWHDRHLRHHSYAHVGAEDLSSGDIGRLQHEGDEDPTELDMYSPFEDRPEDMRAGRTMFAATAVAAATSGRGYGKLADREMDSIGYDDERLSYDGRSDFDTHEDPSSGPSIQSHSTASKSDVPSSSKSQDVLSPGGIVSFSDASSRGRHSGNNTMKRSPTWWDRFMGTSSMERSASGRFLTGPNAQIPIRDPAPPPLSGLEAITESPRSREVSEARPQDPFADLGGKIRSSTYAGGEPDEMGRRVATDANGNDAAEAYAAHAQGHSLSSIGSARTGASSHFESRLRGMDVIQRVRTGSSRRTQSTRVGSTMSDTDSEPALSRGPTLLRPRNVASSDALREESDSQSTPGSVVWRPEDFLPGAGSTKELEDLAEEEDVTLSTRGKDGSPPPLAARHTRRQSNISETPSITPLTTKRARLNPVMISPLFPSAHPHRPSQPHALAAAGAGAGAGAKTSTSVKDKVKAFESATTAADTVASSAWTASLSSAKSARTPPPPLISTHTTGGGEGGGEEPLGDRATSPQGSQRAKKQKYLLTHGLAPKPQLFVANPDAGRRNTSDDSQP
ncbi:hypothetical protein EX895_000368 [Sporisorium graminicola]|uniref:Galactose oxidase n=1 Tax=Sporisorium graminicola TaxID=280036 RepID=A0A4U7L0P6_9BASI|nr:hypothetical protein EX895_000368 [Sporisorium graminicola]TKY90370.1 hypothetical protein EX895_000368 [Sporisorium graminicola]